MAASSLSPVTLPFLDQTKVFFRGRDSLRDTRLLVKAPPPLETKGKEGGSMTSKICVYLRCIQCHPVDMTQDSQEAPKVNKTFDLEPSIRRTKSDDESARNFS